MKIVVSLFVILISFVGFGQTIKELWAPILEQKDAANYFSGMWESLGINVEATSESITVYHKGDHFELKDGVDEAAVDYNVFLQPENITNMARHGADGKIDAYESYKIMGALFTPFMRSSLTHPMMNKAFQLRIANIENHVHVYLESPTNDEFVAHTLLFINKKWLVVEGIQGEAQREFRMSPEQAIAYQRAAFSAQKENTRKSWKGFKKFYLKWREEVSVVI